LVRRLALGRSPIARTGAPPLLRSRGDRQHQKHRKQAKVSHSVIRVVRVASLTLPLCHTGE
jgi:hypothetical protein